MSDSTEPLQNLPRNVPPGPERDAYLPLLDLADDSEAQVRGYYQSGDLYALDDPEFGPLAIVLAIPAADGAIELKSVAVHAQFHGRGVGTRLVHAVHDDLRAQGIRRVVVGTSSSSIGPLRFYQRCGFRLWKIERDYFTPERGYAAGLEENGIPVRDMVWLDRDIQ